MVAFLPPSRPDVSDGLSFTPVLSIRWAALQVKLASVTVRRLHFVVENVDSTLTLLARSVSLALRRSLFVLSRTELGAVFPSVVVLVSTE